MAACLEGQDARPSIEGYGIYARLHYRIEQFFRQRWAGAQTSSAGKADAHAMAIEAWAVNQLKEMKHDKL